MEPQAASLAPLAKRPLVLSLIGTVIAGAFLLGLLVGYWHFGKPEVKPVSRNEQLILWLARVPWKMNPPLPPEERRFYDTWDEWVAVGLKIPDIERDLISRLEIGTSVFPAWLYVEALGSVGGDESVTPLIKVIKYEGLDNYTLQLAAASLGILRSPRAVEPLCRLAMSTQDQETVLVIILALGEIGDPKGKPTIEELLRTRHFDDAQRKMIDGALSKLASK